MLKKMIILLLCFAIMSGNICHAFFDLPDISRLEAFPMMEATQVFDCNGRLIAKLFEENRIVVPIQDMSPYIQQAIVANEDSRFYQHIGIDPIGILRAFWVDLRSGHIVEGGSTITQQLAKNLFLTQKRTIIRKIKEMILALEIERKFSKQEILQAYLNQVYFGEGAYGVEAAAQVYFGKPAKDLTLAESALLAGLPRGPNIYSPYVDSTAALARRAVVLDGMIKQGYITRAQALQAEATPIVLAGKRMRKMQASYFLDYLANELVKRYGTNRVYKGGLKVYTTLDSKIQQAAEKVLGKYQGGVFVMDPRTGYIKAMVGGRNYQESQINRVVAAVRQPGSAFKPFVYAQALNQGLAANTVIVDEPIDISGYQPHNYDGKFRGPITLKKALRWSINVVAVKLAQRVGIVPALDLAKSMGITTLVPEDDNLAAALGGLTRGVSLYELTAAYSGFANRGIVSKPLAILKVLDEDDQVLEEDTISQQAVLKPEIAYILTNMLEGVVTDGTGTGANIGRSAAGKTGTTDNYQNAWFIGYTPDLLAGIYVGNDDRTPVNISGTQVAQMWGKMMVKVVSGTTPSDFSVPDNVITGVPVCANTGKYAGPECKDVEHDAFIKGTEPLPGRQEQDAGNGSIWDWRLWKQLFPRLPSF
jgi:penicillin-binding protein 1A